MLILNGGTQRLTGLRRLLLGSRLILRRLDCATKLPSLFGYPAMRNQSSFNQSLLSSNQYHLALVVIFLMRVLNEALFLT